MEIDDDLDPNVAIEARESRGLITLRVNSKVYPEDAVEAFNATTMGILEGRQWFQLWKGEIVSMDSPEDPRQGGTVARLHRGPVDQEAPESRHRGA
jgi:hypothetical protein